MIYIETLKKRERETREAIKTNAMEKARKVALMLKKSMGSRG